MERETILWGTGIELEVRRYQPTNDKQPHPCERSCEGCFALPQIGSEGRPTASCIQKVSSRQMNICSLRSHFSIGSWVEWPKKEGLTGSIA